MKAIICTLFEHHYHLGAAVMVNSLCRAGFSGKIYAGFRGPLPPWAQGCARKISDGRWELEVTPVVRVIFLTLETPAHLTNYKPDFLLHLEKLAGAESDAVIYMDPDIVVNAKWSYVEEWLTCGLALCEDINSPVRRNNPVRVGWQRFFQPLGYELKFRGDEYANGGFFGMSWEYRQFLVTWQIFLAHIATALGGSDVVGIAGGRYNEDGYGFADCFAKSDQDALNAALEAHPEIPASFLGQATMGFAGGDTLLPHALGGAKPWRRRYLREALGGRAPRGVDKWFWLYADGPLHPFTSGHIASKRVEVRLAAGIGRMMRRGG